MSRVYPELRQWRGARSTALEDAERRLHEALHGPDRQ
jgi:hypothetical protein